MEARGKPGFVDFSPLTSDLESKGAGGWIPECTYVSGVGASGLSYRGI